MKTLRPLVLACVLGLVATTAAAHAWQQQEVSALAGQLIEALEAMLADPGLDARQATAVQQREHRAAIATARRLEQLAVDYKKRIDAGYDREESRPFWEQIALLRGDIQAYARSSSLPAPAEGKAERVSALLDQLAHYYPEPS